MTKLLVKDLMIDLEGGDRTKEHLENNTKNKSKPSDDSGFFRQAMVQQARQQTITATEMLVSNAQQQVESWERTIRQRWEVYNGYKKIRKNRIKVSK